MMDPAFKAFCFAESASALRASLRAAKPYILIGFWMSKTVDFDQAAVVRVISGEVFADLWDKNRALAARYVDACSQHGERMARAFLKAAIITAESDGQSRRGEQSRIERYFEELRLTELIQSGQDEPAQLRVTRPLPEELIE